MEPTVEVTLSNDCSSIFSYILAFIQRFNSCASDESKGANVILSAPCVGTQRFIQGLSPLVQSE